MIKKLCLFFMSLGCVFLLTACSKQTPSDGFWGSFTEEKTYSYDHKYYAVQTIKVGNVYLNIYDTGSDELVDHFSTDREQDFWGICWEKDTYNIWTQSGDTGICCYEYQNEKWIHNKDIVVPDYIISKYDKEYRDNPELQKNIWKSPTD